MILFPKTRFSVSNLVRLDCEMANGQYPTVQFKFAIRPGQTGVDVRALGNGPQVTGFQYADIKPMNGVQQAELQSQVANWGYQPGEVQPITYDTNGNIYNGF